mgnify:CR=1 FL=1
MKVIRKNRTIFLDILGFLFNTPDNSEFLITEVHGGRLHLILKENTGNIVGSFALDGQSENAAHHGGGFLVDQPMVFVFRVFPVAIDSAVGGGLAGFSLDADGGFLLAAQVAQIPLVHDVEEGRKLVAVLSSLSTPLQWQQSGRHAAGRIPLCKSRFADSHAPPGSYP